ncbi:MULTISPECIES: hypothetical protein [unclassified Rhizobium]|nr:MULTISPECIES: hypothetical protein [unclassified Rhizobium]MBB3393607.1 hypothetical protein [Rhizobium sp. BK060]MBB4166326.1 hypothetical protein [Rhizobium sp. BK538]
MIEVACFGAIELKGSDFVKRALRYLPHPAAIAAQTRFVYAS